MGNLRRPKRVVLNACPMCLADEEIVDLLLRCKFGQALLSHVLRCFDCS